MISRNYDSIKQPDSNEMKAKLIELLQNPETDIQRMMLISNEIIIVFNKLPTTK